MVRHCWPGVSAEEAAEEKIAAEVADARFQHPAWAGGVSGDDEVFVGELPAAPADTIIDASPETIAFRVEPSSTVFHDAVLPFLAAPLASAAWERMQQLGS